VNKPHGEDALQSVDDFFGRHLHELSGRALLAGYENYAMSCEIDFPDHGESWLIVIEGGAICHVGPLEPDGLRGRVRFVVTEPVFWDIVEGRMTPQTAFFRRKTDIKGDLFEGMKLAKLLALFFSEYPYRG
jgi:hypothetical protein